jgi:hypothetical protein
LLTAVVHFFLRRNAQSKQYAPYGVIRTALMGYLHESMQNCGTALEHYARGGCLIEQRRLMFCLVQQFLGAFLTPQDMSDLHFLVFSHRMLVVVFKRTWLRVSSAGSSYS